VSDYPEGTILIEIRGLFDGWSCAKLPSGELVNRWEPNARLYVATQEWIDGQERTE
jgi:hypothetical protein